jgi:hypothetical protein
MTKATLNYRPPSRKPVTLGRILVWLMPAWCLLMTFGVFSIVGREIELLWFVALGMPLVVAGVCFWLQERQLAMYCIATSLLLLAVTTALPYINRAT